MAIDTGPTKHGIVVYDSEARRALHADGAASTDLVLSTWLSTTTFEEQAIDLYVIEQIVGMGMSVGAATFETAHAGGRFHQRALDLQAASSRRAPVHRVPRRGVLKALGVTRGEGSSDSRVLRRLVELHGGPNNPKTRTGAKGYKDSPGPLYGVKSHAWQALGLAYVAAHFPAVLNG